jgi:hypothetical protein
MPGLQPSPVGPALVYYYYLLAQREVFASVGFDCIESKYSGLRNSTFQSLLLKDRVYPGIIAKKEGLAAHVLHKSAGAEGLFSSSPT